MIGALLLYTITDETLSEKFTKAIEDKGWFHEPDQSTYQYPEIFSHSELYEFDEWIKGFFNEDDLRHIKFIDLYYPSKDIPYISEIKKYHFTK